MRHGFYEGVSFEDVLNAKVEAPWVPEIKSQGDTSNFEKYPEGKDSAKKILPELDEVFNDF